MFTKELVYTDFNGVERKETFYFNLMESELTELELGTSGGLSSMIQRIIDSKEIPELIEVFKNLIAISYGEKSPDGKYFMKEDADGHKLVNRFKQTNAYSKLYMELATDSTMAAKFVNGLFPEGLNKEKVSQFPANQ